MIHIHGFMISWFMNLKILACSLFIAMLFFVNHFFLTYFFEGMVCSGGVLFFLIGRS